MVITSHCIKQIIPRHFVFSTTVKLHNPLSFTKLLIQNSQTSHGDPVDPMKHAGDLGNLDFGPVPDDWPTGMETCEEVQFWDQS